MADDWKLEDYVAMSLLETVPLLVDSDTVLPSVFSTTTTTKFICMDYITYSEKLQYIKTLAQRGSTGTCKELADRLGVSESTVKRMIRCLRILGVNIKFCSYRRSYKIVSED
ncbi:MAG: HTH domain-containing protein [Marinifilaceae bacterium]|jgi:biotin operon repressor